MLRKNRAPVLVIMAGVIAMATTACSGEDGSSPALGETYAAPAETEEDAPKVYPFGGVARLPDNSTIAVSPPDAYKPSQTAAWTGSGKPVLFSVQYVNKSNAGIDPSLTSITVASGGVEGYEIFDSEKGLNGAPTTTVLPGQARSWRVAFEVQNPASITMDVNVGIVGFQKVTFNNGS